MRSIVLPGPGSLDRADVFVPALRGGSPRREPAVCREVLARCGCVSKAPVLPTVITAGVESPDLVVAISAQIGSGVRCMADRCRKPKGTGHAPEHKRAPAQQCRIAQDGVRHGLRSSEDDVGFAFRRPKRRRTARRVRSGIPPGAVHGVRCGRESFGPRHLQRSPRVLPGGIHNEPVASRHRSIDFAT